MLERCDCLLCVCVRRMSAWSVAMNCLYAVSLAAFAIAWELRILSSCCCVVRDVEKVGGVGSMGLLMPVEFVVNGLVE